MTTVFNFQKFKKSAKITLTTAVTVSAMGIQAVNAQSSFKFSDFTFKRYNKPSTTFHTKTYPNGKKGVEAFQQFFLSESVAVTADQLNARKLDPSKLKLIQDYGVKIYFINEGAGYRNQLKLDTIHATNSTANSKDGMIFYDGSIGSGSEELKKGDYVDLGTIAAGSTLDFQLRANGYDKIQKKSKPNSQVNTWYADVSKNIDGIQHVMAFEYEGYLILAFEDLYGGGDKDYNDIVFAIEIGATNLASIPSLPPANLPPVTVNDTATTPYGTPVTIDVLSNDSDPENKALTLSSVNTSLTLNGSVSISNNKAVYTPNEEFSGTDAFVYTVKDDKGLENTATVTVTVEEASCSSNNGHGNNAPVTYDLGSGVKIEISQYDPSNPNGQQTSSLIAALSQGKTGKVGNGANTSYINLISGSSYSMTQQQATALVNSYPDWEMKKDGSVQNCSEGGVTPGTTITIGGGNTGGDNTGGNGGNGGNSGGDNTGGNGDNGGNSGGNPGFECKNGKCFNSQGNEVFVD